VTRQAGPGVPSTPVGRVDVRAAAGSYPVLVGRGLLDRLTEVVVERLGVDRLALVTDDRVGPLHGARVAERFRAGGVDVTYLAFPAGEASKTRESWSRLTDEMLDAGLGRDCAVVAVGGGVTTDLAGFVAATYLRGVPVLQVPTSYLAMIDASVGGKTGVDVRAGKNLVGAFHAPAGVVVDPDVLATLPARERASGLVEGVKHGAALDEAHFAAFERDADALLAADPSAAAAYVLDSIRLKADVVGEDEREAGRRQVLNFGHTLGHALEAASGYALDHGSAVALGMLGEADAGERKGVTEPGTHHRLASVLQPLLETTGASNPEIDRELVMSYLGADKKARRGRPRYVLLERMGRVSEGEGWTHELSDALVEEVLGRLPRKPARDRLY
jgi:3-dehydroquinate synthase